MLIHSDFGRICYLWLQMFFENLCFWEKCVVLTQSVWAKFCKFALKKKNNII